MALSSKMFPVRVCGLSDSYAHEAETAR
jgi:hypothetical protein